MKPYMNILTNELQTAYKIGRSTIDVLLLLNKQIKNEKTEHIILFDLAKAFDSIDRDVMWTILYESGLPENLIKIIQIGHNGIKLCAKNNGKIGSKVNNNKGVFQGSPLSAFLFIIYIESMMEKYESKLCPNTKNNMNTIKIRDDKEEAKWSGHLHLRNIRQKGDRHIKRPGYMNKQKL